MSITKHTAVVGLLASLTSVAGCERVGWGPSPVPASAEAALTEISVLLADTFVTPGYNVANPTATTIPCGLVTIH